VESDEAEALIDSGREFVGSLTKATTLAAVLALF